MKKYHITVNGEQFIVEVEEITNGTVALATPSPLAASPVTSSLPPASTPEPKPAAAPVPASGSGKPISSPLPGTILRINVEAGQTVKAGDSLLVLEAMKMENEITAPQDGVVKCIHVATGVAVQTGDLLMTIYGRNKI